MKELDLNASDIWRKPWTKERWEFYPTGVDVTLTAHVDEIRLSYLQGGPEKGTDFEIRIGLADFAPLLAAVASAMSGAEEDKFRVPAWSSVSTGVFHFHEECRYGQRIHENLCHEHVVDIRGLDKNVVCTECLKLYGWSMEEA